jgi:hypothetical protein
VEIYLNSKSIMHQEGSNPWRFKPFFKFFQSKKGIHLKGLDPSLRMIDLELRWMYACNVPFLLIEVEDDLVAYTTPIGYSQWKKRESRGFV